VVGRHSIRRTAGNPPAPGARAALDGIADGPVGPSRITSVDLAPPAILRRCSPRTGRSAARRARRALRLLAPMKLGLKNIKASPTSPTRPTSRDYWNEQGYSVRGL
jgi:hypothetical protein